MMISEQSGGISSSTHLVVLVVKQSAAPEAEIHPAVVTILDRVEFFPRQIHREVRDSNAQGSLTSGTSRVCLTHPYECLRDSSLVLTGLFVCEVRVSPPGCCQSAHLELPGFSRLTREENQPEGEERMQTGLLNKQIFY